MLFTIEFKNVEVNK